MAARQTAREILGITEDKVQTFLKDIPSTESGILRRINGILRELEIVNGNIKPSVNNIMLLRSLREDLGNIVVNDAYLNKVDTYLSGFDKIKSTTDKLFTISDKFNPNKVLFKEILNSNIGLTKASLTETGIDEFVINPIIDIINNGITSGAPIGEMEETLRLEILGDQKRLGGLERYSSQITRDALNQYARNYNDSISSDLDLEFYFYSGSVIQDSRSYCIRRAGKYWHRKEIEDNIPTEWPGRIPGTNSGNILKNAGGFNCRHIYMPVLASVVPKSVRDRAERKGYFKP